MQEKILKFINCINKKNQYKPITNILKEHAIPLDYCRAQNYNKLDKCG